MRIRHANTMKIPNASTAENPECINSKISQGNQLGPRCLRARLDPATEASTNVVGVTPAVGMPRPSGRNAAKFGR